MPLYFFGPTTTIYTLTPNDVTTGADTNMVDVTGLVFTYAADSVYLIELFGRFTNASATGGSGLAFNLSTTVDFYHLHFFHQLANTGTVTGGNANADDASLGVSSGIPQNNQLTSFQGAGILDSNSNSGTAQLRLRAEVGTAATTIKAGTIMKVTKIA